MPRWPLADVARELRSPLRRGCRFARRRGCAIECTSPTTPRSTTTPCCSPPGHAASPPFDHAQTFSANDPSVLEGLLADLEEGWSRSAAFVVPPGVNWTLPAYELALLTARQVRSMGMDRDGVTVVTPEARPLALFGRPRARRPAELLHRAGVAFEGSAYVQSDRGSTGVARPGTPSLDVERVVTLPVVEGRGSAASPTTTTASCRSTTTPSVIGVDDVFAAGDGADFPIKQGGLATQQADAAAECIAQRAGAALAPRAVSPRAAWLAADRRGAALLRQPDRGWERARAPSPRIRSGRP